VKLSRGGSNNSFTKCVPRCTQEDDPASDIVMTSASRIIFRLLPGSIQIADGHDIFWNIPLAYSSTPMGGRRTASWRRKLRMAGILSVIAWRSASQS